MVHMTQNSLLPLQMTYPKLALIFVGKCSCLGDMSLSFVLLTRKQTSTEPV